MPFLVIKKRSIVLAILMMLVVALLATNLTGSPFASVFFARVERKLPIYAVETEEKKVAISFDAAWGADKTEGIIELLQEFDVQATFFLVGFWVDEHKDKVEFIDKAGYEIGTHSNTHPDMALLGEEEIEKVEKNNIITLSDKQKEAIKAVNENNVTIITGGPGTRKNYYY